jgi:predicted phosphoribosyltransferase
MKEGHLEVSSGTGRIRPWGLASIAALVTLMLAGCGSLAIQNPIASTSTAQSIPRVQDCAVLSTGSPSRFACNGKVYTSFQLAKLREDEAKKYTSGQ